MVQVTDFFAAAKLAATVVFAPTETSPGPETVTVSAQPEEQTFVPFAGTVE